MCASERTQGHGRSPGALINLQQNTTRNPSLYGHAEITLDPRRRQIVDIEVSPAINCRRAVNMDLHHLPPQDSLEETVGNR